MVELADVESIGAMDLSIARSIKERLQKIPPNRSKAPQYRNKSLREIIALQPKTTLSVTTVNKYLTRMSAFFDWAKRHGYTGQNWFDGLQIKGGKTPREQRDRFSDEDLRALFSSDIFSNHALKHPYYYWLPLLALHTGCRVNELSQLLVDDVTERGGIAVLSVNDDGEKRLKNASSKRLIPLHSVLIELGFLEYVEAKRQTQSKQLFPKLKPRRVDQWYASR